MASSHSSRSSTTPATNATARSPVVPVDGDHSDRGAQKKERAELRRGPWTVDEDLALVNYITDHGEGRWNTLAPAAGLKRTGKSCRLRWLNYLRPDVKRGNFTADEQLLILDLHSRYGSRWSKIAQHLPGRTDNEIKNYWRTRVQKHAKQLNCDANSKSFKDAMRYLWMPHLVDAHRRLLTHHADDDHHHHLQAADQADAYRYHTGMAGGVTSSSSDSFAPTTSESYAAATASFLPKGWDPSAPSRYDDEMLASGGGDCWVPQDMSQQQQAGVVWPADEQQAAKAVNGTGGGQFEVDAELSGWVQGFSEGGVTTDENSFWTLEDIWKTQ